MAIWAIGDLQGCYAPTQRLLERIRCAGTSGTLGVYVQYVAALLSLPLVRMCESDIVVSIFRKK